MNELIKSVLNDDYRFPALMSPRFLTNFLDSLEAADRDPFDVRAEYPYNINAKVDKNGNAEKYVIEFALAGFKKEDISVRVEHDKLLISVNNKVLVVENEEGTKLDEAVEKVQKVKEDLNLLEVLHKGIARRSMKTYFNLGGGIDKKKISTKFEDGMLTIEVPIKAEDAFDVSIN